MLIKEARRAGGDGSECTYRLYFEYDDRSFHMNNIHDSDERASTFAFQD